MCISDGVDVSGDADDIGIGDGERIYFRERFRNGLVVNHGASLVDARRYRVIICIRICP